MKQTEKYKAGVKTAKAIGEKTPRGIENDALYQILERAGYFWQPDSKEWTEDRPATSIFEDGEGVPTGIYRLRLMGSPADLKAACKAITGALNIVEMSDAYPNRKGPGVRVYMTCKLEAKS